MTTSLDHCAIRTTRLEESRRFYEGLLGLEVGPRPDLPVPGYWLYDGERPVVHLIELPETAREDVFGEPLTADSAPGVRNGVDHLAFRVVGLDATRGRLQDAGLAYKEMAIAQLRLTQLFVRDPNGITAELNFFLDDEETADDEEAAV